MLKTLAALLVLSFSSALYAQTPAQTPPGADPAKKPRAERRLDCSKAKDPQACEERVARRAQAREACKGKEGEALRSCLREQRKKN